MWINNGWFKAKWRKRKCKITEIKITRLFIYYLINLKELVQVETNSQFLANHMVVIIKIHIKKMKTNGKEWQNIKKIGKNYRLY